MILRAPVQDGLGADCLCVVDVGINTRDRHVEAGVALVLDNHDNNFWIVLFQLFDKGSVALPGFMREVKNALGYQII
jgi:hypothetical protein